MIVTETVAFWIGYIFGALLGFLFAIASGWLLASYICQHTSLGTSNLGKTLAVIISGFGVFLISIVFLYIPVGIYALIKWWYVREMTFFS